MRHSLNKTLGIIAVLGFGATSIAQTQAASCTYSIDKQWSSGFNASITIKNDTNKPINGWTVGWKYNQNKMVKSWNATVTGSNPYTAKDVGFNANINPGESVSFGVKGSKASGSQAEKPSITGAVCGAAPASVSAKSASSKPVTSPSSKSAFSLPPSSIGPSTSSRSSSSIRPSSSSATTSAPSTSGKFRVDTAGNITKDGTILPVRCGNWFGLEGRHEPANDAVNPNGAPMELYVGNMSWANGNRGTGRTIQQTMTEITNMGINVVRLPIVPQTLDANDPQGKSPNLKNHTSVRGLNARQSLEEFIKLAAANNINLIIDIHACSNYIGWRAGRLDARPPYVDSTHGMNREAYSCAATGNPSSVKTIHAYNETKWLNNLKEIAGLSAKLGVDNILGIDIYNEPYDYTWSDWKTLSEKAYTAINSVNPNLLIVVEGISASANSQDGSPTTTTKTPHGDAALNPNWGENFYEQRTNPLNIPKDRLVFSPHTYGPSVAVQPQFLDPSQPECAGLEGNAAAAKKCKIVINETLLEKGWEEHFGYLRSQGYAMIVGEFGGDWEWPTQAHNPNWGHVTSGIYDGQWQMAFAKYAKRKKIQACYWGINPESGDTGGWYGHEFDAVKNPAGWGQWKAFDARKTNVLNTLWGF